MNDLAPTGRSGRDYLGYNLTAARGYSSAPLTGIRSPEAIELLKTLEEWRYEAHVAHAENRREQAIDCDYHDGDQLTPREFQVLLDRGQPPLKYNVIAQQILWLTGTERRTRVDYRVSPRSKEDNEGAIVKTKVLKYLSDINDAAEIQSKAFNDAVTAGVGWLEDAVNPEESGLGMIYTDSPSWREMFWDPMSKHPDINRDCRYILREKYVDLDIAISMFPQFEIELRSAAEIGEMFPLEDEDFYYLNLQRTGDYGMTGRGMPGYGVGMGAYDVTSRRRRVRIYECWYKKPCSSDFLRCDFDPGLDDMTKVALTYLDGTDYNPLDEIHGRVLNAGLGSIVQARRMKVFCAIWIDRAILQHMASPYRHNRFPYTPIWVYRRSRDGMPYGPIRNWRDPQDDLNKRHSKTLHILNTRGLIADDNAFDDWDEVEEELARPDFILKKRQGAEVTLNTDTKLAEEHIRLMEKDETFIQSIGGVSADAMGQQTNARDGKALDRRMSAGTVVTTVLFENFRFALKQSGEIRLSLVEQFATRPEVIRLLGEDGVDSYEQINFPYYKEDGSLHWRNDITRTQADFVVSLTEYNDTVRQAMVESLMDLIGQLGRTAPEAALSLLDLVVELMDVPNRDAFVKRVRKINGQVDPTDETAVAAQEAQEAEAAQFQKAVQMLLVQNQSAKTDETRARTEKLLAEISQVLAETSQTRQEVIQGVVGEPGPGAKPKIKKPTNGKA